MRAGRVTASKLHKVCTFNKDKPATSTIEDVCYSGKKSKSIIPSLKWGLNTEARAREAYTQKVADKYLDMKVE